MFATVTAALDAVDLSSIGDHRAWPDAAVRGALIDAERLASRLRLAQARLLSEAKRRDLARQEGCTSPTAWLSRHLGVSRGEAVRRLDEEAAVSASPEVAGARGGGGITPPPPPTIGSTHQAEPDMSTGELLAHARMIDAGRFAHRAARLRRAQQADGGLSQHEGQRRARTCSLWIRPDDGMVVLHAELDPVDGARVRARLLARAEALWRADHPDRAEPASRTERTGAQRMADALVDLCTSGPSPGGPASGAGGGGGDDVEVLVTIDHATLVSDLAGQAEILGVGPIPAATARRLACEAGLIPVVLGGRGETLDLGRSRRLANRAQRRALRRQHRHCAWRGCTVPFEWCQVHHIQPWLAGGSTDLANLVPLCSGHHHLVHEGGWTIRAGPDGRLDPRPPATDPDCRSGPTGPGGDADGDAGCDPP